MRVAVVATVLSLVAVLAYAETRTTLTSRRQQSLDSGLTLHVTARETVVDVTVTDSHGKPVRGLKREDFTLNEDGKPQPLRSFQEFNSSTPASTATLRKLPPNTYTNVETGTGPLYVLLDTGKWAGQFIKNLAPGTRFVEIAGLTILRGSSAELELRPGMVIGHNLLKIQPGMTGCTLQVLLDWQKLDMLKQLATFLSGIPGRKNLIWVGRGMSDLVWNGCQLWTGPLQETYNLLEDAQITVYPVDPAGVEVFQGSTLTGPPIVQGSTKEDIAWLDEPPTEHLSMEAVAEATGGLAFYNTNDIASAIANAADAGASYYTLSYAPPSAEYDSRYHAINIKIDRPDVHPLYRNGYSAVDPALIEHPPETLLGFVSHDTRPTGAAADPFVAAMSPIAPPATQLLFDVHVQPSIHAEPSALSHNPADLPAATFGTLGSTVKDKLKDQPLTRYSFQYAIPARQITFTDGPNATHQGSLELDLAAYSADGTLVTSLSQTVKMPLSDEKYKHFIQGPFQFSQQLDLPPGQLFLRVGILDPTSKKIGTLEIPLTIPRTSPNQAAATPAK